MPLFDYLSGDEDAQRSEIEEFLSSSSRWTNVGDEEAVSKARKTGRSFGWYWQEFAVLDHKVLGQDRIEVDFSFKAIGYDEREKQTDEVLTGTAKSWIDEHDNVEFMDVEAEVTDSSD